jgi:hypothetical protein
MARDAMAGSQSFSVGGVLSASIAVLLRNFISFGAIALLVGIPMIVLTALGADVNINSSTFEVRTQPGAELSPGAAIGIAVFSIVILLTYFVTQAAINYGSFQDLRGRRAGIGECISRGFGALPRVILAILVLVFGIVVPGLLVFLVASVSAGLGAFLAIPVVIGYFVALLMFWVFVPAIVVERVGPVACFGRSRTLTKGHRWGILGLFVIIAIAQSLVTSVAGLVGTLGGPAVAAVLHTFVTLLFTAFGGVVTAVGYFYLRAEKEGIVIDDIASVFD